MLETALRSKTELFLRDKVLRFLAASNPVRS